jgi:hypothetical protein
MKNIAREQPLPRFSTDNATSYLNITVWYLSSGLGGLSPGTGCDLGRAVVSRSGHAALAGDINHDGDLGGWWLPLSERQRVYARTSLSSGAQGGLFFGLSLVLGGLFFARPMRARSYVASSIHLRPALGNIGHWYYSFRQLWPRSSGVQNFLLRVGQPFGCCSATP